MSSAAAYVGSPPPPANRDECVGLGADPGDGAPRDVREFRCPPPFRDEGGPRTPPPPLDPPAPPHM